MSQIYLIRHSISQPDLTIPSDQWRLSHAGRKMCERLSQRLSEFGLHRMISSIEPKSIETAQLAAQHLGISYEIVHGLHEHDRSNVGFLPQDRFDASVKELFQEPERCVFGSENANQALTRFSDAINQVKDMYVGEKIGFVSHGIVMSLFAAKHNQINAYEYWGKLTMPAIMIVSVNGFGLLETINFTQE